MKSYNVNELKANYALSDDSYILDNLFFLPKSLPIKEYHINLLRKWNITEIKSDGQLSAITLKETIAPTKEPLEELPTELTTDEEIDNSLLQQEEIEKLEPGKDESLTVKGALTSKSFVEIYKYWIKETVKIFKNFLIEKDVDKERVKNFVDDIIRITSKNKSNALMLFGKKFEGVLYVFPQTIETVILANIIAESRQMNPLATSNLTLATFFHDFGMLKIPLSLLEKTEKLSDKEMSIIQSHTIIGYKYLRDARYSAIIASGALQHHERLDGKGYPQQLTGDKITEIAKIISVVDAYCAAIASKPFKESPQHAKLVLQELLNKGGTVYDANILKELIKNISLYPIGSLVLLSNDKIALVVGVSKAAMRPKVKIIEEGKDGEIIDLSERSDLFIKSLYKPQK